MLSKFIKEKEGQAIGLFPVVAIVLVVAVFFVYNIGNYYYTYIREQNAIDAAVYSGAAMQADALNVIVIINKSLLTIYGLSCIVCAACIVAAALSLGITASGVSPCCGAAGMVLTAVEKAALITMEMINKGSAAFSLAAMDIYKKSGGRAKLPNYGVLVSTLKLEKVYWNNFLKPTAKPPFFWPKKTFMGMAEKKTYGVYDWAGGKTKKPYVYGSFGKPKKGKSGGLYDKKGPGAVGWVRVRFTPSTSWFKKFSKNIYLAAQARPYGGNVGTAMQSQSFSETKTRTDITTDVMGNVIEKTKSKTYSRKTEAFPLPWGKASFKAKLVPIGY